MCVEKTYYKCVLLAVLSRLLLLLPPIMSDLMPVNRLVDEEGEEEEEVLPVEFAWCRAAAFALTAGVVRGTGVLVVFVV